MTRDQSERKTTMPMQRALSEAFRTRRLLAVRLDDRHLDQCARLDADPEVKQWLSGVRSPDGTTTWVHEEVTPHWRDHGYGIYALFEKQAECAPGGSGRELVGRAGLQHRDIGGVDEVELGCAIAPAYWGHGYATEIGRMFVGLALGSLDLESVVARTTPDNAAWLRVLEKLGFEYEDEVDSDDRLHALYRVARAGRDEPPADPLESR